MAPVSTKGKKRVKFELHAGKKSTVHVAGSFNGWSSTKNKLKYKDGAFTTSILLSKGKYEYKFLVDGIWCVDPECKDWAPNEHGSLNSVITVG